MRSAPTGDGSAGMVAGVDTHTDTHTLAVLTSVGQVVSTETFAADQQGYQNMIHSLQAAGTIEVVGVEGTNSYGAGLTRALSTAGYRVAEVLRPARQVRRMHGKSDPVDAVAAARTVLADDGVSEAKDTHAPAESLRFLLTARAQLIQAMTAMISSIRSLLVTADDQVREKYRDLPTAELVSRLANSRPGQDITTPAEAASYSLRQMARTYRENQQRADQLESQMKTLLEAHYPHLLTIYGVKTITASKLAVTAGGNPGRIRNEAAFASLCGAAPIPASSGKTNRHRLNRGGDRRGNSALHRIALVRMRHDPTTRAYVERRLGQNKTKKDIIRCLKRAIAREVYKALTRPQEVRDATPEGAELGSQRKAQQLTLSDAARALDTWPARISDIEKHRRPLPDLANRYHHWLIAA